MAQKTLKEEAQSYETPAKTKNIVDLPKVTTNLTVEEETHTDKEGKEFTIKTVEVEGSKYRVPNSVLNQLKVLLEDNPDLENFKVKKTGTGLDTEYIVIPLQ